MEKHKLTAEQLEQASRQHHIDLKKAYGLEYLNFYANKKGQFRCKYISDPCDISYPTCSKDTLHNADLMFLLNALSMQQGRVFFDDYKQHCVGLDELNRLYLPMKLSGL